MLVLATVLLIHAIQRVRPTTRRREALLMAVTLILCRQGNVPRTFAELSKVSQVPKRDIGACYKWLCATLNPDMVIIRHSEPDEFMASRFWIYYP
jgi:transcription initiation factor TFIIIB Brf1 subunit/transcription initiation factor TFIIB